VLAIKRQRVSASLGFYTYFQRKLFQSFIQYVNQLDQKYKDPQGPLSRLSTFGHNKAQKGTTGHGWAF
jgi:hypothetical protein